MIARFARLGLAGTVLAACTGGADVAGEDPAVPSDPPVTGPTSQPPTSPPTTPPEPTTPPPPTVGVGSLVFDGDTLPTNLLVVSLDTTRRDHIGRFADPALPSDTPNLDAVLDTAYVLENHRSCANWTGPSMTCVTSGNNPMENGFWPWADDDAIDHTPPRTYRTLAGRLSEAGWQTTLVTANSVFSSDLGLDAGFDRQVRVDWQPAPDVAAAGLAEAQALSGASPWYLHVHFIDPHGNYCAPEEYVDLAGIADLGWSADDVCNDTYGPGYQWWSQPPQWQQALIDTYEALYRGELRYWDTTFGQFWTELDARGVLDDTLVVFVTDHGQQFFEHGGHGHGLYLGTEENASTAAFWAKNLHPGAWTGLTLHQDLTQTLFDLYGISGQTSGMTVGTGAPDRAVRAMNYWGVWDGPHLSIVKGERQLLFDWWGDRAFYRLDTDPGALVDVYDPNDPDVADLWTDMDAWIADIRAYWPHLPPPTQPGP